MDTNWQAYKSARNSYYSVLNTKKKEIIWQQIEECAKDPGKLHKLVNQLTTKNEQLTWPHHNDKQQLAEDFTTFFESKILKIRELFKNVPAYNPEQKGVPKFTRFAPMSTREVTLIINSMKAKSCQLDCIPTHILKMLLPKTAPLITKIVNASLNDGEFCAN